MSAWREQMFIVLAMPVWMLAPASGAKATVAAPDPTSTTSTSNCIIDATYGNYKAQKGVLVDGHCVSATAVAGSGNTDPGPVTRTVDCGKPPNQRRDHNNGSRWNYKDCGPRVLRCQQPSPSGGAPTPVDAFITQTQDRISRAWTSSDAWCPATATPIPDTALLRQQAIRLLPHVTIGTTSHPNQISTAPVSLVNIQTILWAQTAATRDLGQATVLGQPVHLRITLAHANWDFGDGSAGTTTTAGKVYDEQTDPCTTARCPDYYGHIYTRAGNSTVTLTIAWTASYSLDAVHYQPIGDTTITGPTATATITLRQAHGILVTTPH